jgi:hypothetical protein
MATVDDPDALKKRISQSRDVSKYVTDVKALTVIEELVVELTAKVGALRRQKIH